jgi:hypothetical protein
VRREAPRLVRALRTKMPQIQNIRVLTEHTVGD